MPSRAPIFAAQRTLKDPTDRRTKLAIVDRFAVAKIDAAISKPRAWGFLGS